jgi:hypothetical protein
MVGELFFSAANITRDGLADHRFSPCCAASPWFSVGLDIPVSADNVVEMQMPQFNSAIRHSELPALYFIANCEEE